MITRGASATPNDNWVRYQNYKILLNTPAGWKIEKDLYGMPLMVLGPERNGERAVLSVQHTPIYGMEFNQTLLLKTKNQYYEGRKKWIDGLDGAKYLSEIPYRQLKWTNGNEGFEMGFRYHARDIDLDEKSIQVNCGNRLFLFKTLTSNKLPASDTAILANFITELDCVATTPKDGAYEPSPLQDFAQRFQDTVSGTSPWPTLDQLKNANAPAKAAMLEALVEFYKNYEDAGGADVYSINSNAKADEYFAKIKDRTDHLFSLFLSTATAKDAFDCFFGGWPSKLIKRNGINTCGYPWDTNPSYSKNKSSCSEGKLACNPSLFGSDICVDVESANDRAHATLRCEMGFRAAGRSYEDVLKDPRFDQAILADTLESAKDVCSEGAYASANYGLCSTLKEKLGISLSASNHAQDESDVKFINGLDEMKPENFDQYVKATEAHFKEFEARCIDEKGDLKTEVEHCLEDHLAILADLEKIDRRSKDLGKELQEDQPPVSHHNNNCSKADCSAPAADTVSSASTDKAEPSACTVAQEKKKKDRACSWSKGMFVAGSCAWNAITALVSDLWGTIKAVGELAWDGVKWVGGKAVQGTKWFAGLFGYEDESSKKLNTAAQTSNSAIEAFKKDPMGAAINFFKTIYDGVADFVSTDVACEKWSGVPHFSTCLVSASSWKCQPCLDRVDTVCSMVGYVIGELAPAFITGGVSSAIKGSATAAKISKYVGEVSKMGKLTRLEADVLKVVGEGGKVSRAAKLEAKALRTELKISGEMSKSQKILGKIYNVSRWPASKYNKVKNVYAATKKVLADFKSKAFGKFDHTIERLKGLRDKYFVAKAGTWAVNQVIVKPMKAITKLASFPARYSIRGAKKYYGMQEHIYKAGLKYGERTFNHELVNVVNADHYSKLSKTFAVYGASAKYAVTGSHLLDEFRERISLRNENNAGVFWKTPKEIEAQARAEGKNPEAVMELLKKNKINQMTNTLVMETLTAGKEPKEIDLNYLAKIRGITTDDLRLESIDSRLQTIASGATPSFTNNDYAAIARAKKTTVADAQNQVQAEVQVQVATAKVVTLLDQGQKPSDEALQNLARVKNTSVDEIVIESINRRIMSAMGKVEPKFSNFDYETWARANNITVDEAKKYINAEVQDSLNMVTQEKSK